MTAYVLEVHLHGVLFQGLEKVPFIAHMVHSSVGENMLCYCVFHIGCGTVSSIVVQCVGSSILISGIAQNKCSRKQPWFR